MSGKYCITISAVLLTTLFFISCEQSDSPCLDIDCLNGGTCNEGVCDCPPPYGGENCDVLIGCYVDPCLNGGICTPQGCNCPSGYWGPLCEYSDSNRQEISFRIKGIDIVSFPRFKEDGSSWDSISRPDIYLTFNEGMWIVDDSSRVTETIENAIYEGTKQSPAASFEVDLLINGGNSYTIGVFDEDLEGEDEEIFLLSFNAGNFARQYLYVSDFTVNHVGVYSVTYHLDWW